MSPVAWSTQVFGLVPNSDTGAVKELLGVFTDKAMDSG